MTDQAVPGNPNAWHSRDIKFDILKNEMEQTKGEKIFWTQPHIEDAKGNEGDTGTMTTTNMRIIWYETNDPKINLSIGLQAILSVEIKNTYSQNTGNSQTLHIKARFKKSRFEFIFKSMLGDQPKVFKVFKSVFDQFEKAKLYRELKMKGGDIVQNKDLLLLEHENVISKYTNVLSVGSDQAAKGIFYLTNVRIVWFAVNNQTLNISIPWIQIKTIKQQKLKQGPAIIIDTYTAPCGYQVQDGLEDIVQECQKMFKFYTDSPEYGVYYVDDQNQQQKLSQVPTQLPSFQDEEIEFVETGYNDRSQVKRHYKTNQDLEEDNQQSQVVYAPEFGLAVERPQNDVSLEELWKIIKISK